MNETIKKFGYPDTLIREYDNWVILLRPKQVTIASLVVVAKSDATNLGELDGEVWAEFAQVTQETEHLLKKSFGAEKFNYLALMMKDPHVHFHLIPRYSTPVEINGISYADRDWPLKTEMQPIEIADKGIATIKAKLRA